MRNPFLGEPLEADEPAVEARFQLPGHALQRVASLPITLHALICLRTDLVWVDVPIHTGTPVAIQGIPASQVTVTAKGQTLTLSYAPLSLRPIYRVMAVDAAGATLQVHSASESSDGAKRGVTLVMGAPIDRLRMQVTRHACSVRADFAMTDIAVLVAPPATQEVPLKPTSERSEPEASVDGSPAPGSSSF